MFRLLLIGVMCLIIPYTAIAAGSTKANAWADVGHFCNSQHTIDDIKKCHILINQYQEATKKHFRALSAKNLRRISDEIDKLADVDSKQSKNMRDAIKNIGDTLRKPIEIPSGVRNMQNAPAQQYIQQQIPSTL